MNVKTFASMVRVSDLDNNPLRIILCAGAEKEYEVISQYDPDSPYHVSAFGNWKIKNVTAAYENSFELVIDTLVQVVDLVDLRLAYTNGGTPYACIWLYRPCKRDDTGKITVDGMWSNGSGTAGGGGYHKGSAAVDTAIRSAGVKLSQSINGLGDSAIKEAVKAIGEALDTENPVYIVEMYA